MMENYTEPDFRLFCFIEFFLLSLFAVNSRLIARGAYVGAMHPLQIWMHPLGICKISKTYMMVSPLNNV
jgi:hypothetical protein